jgi:hypothetical protein
VISIKSRLKQYDKKFYLYIKKKYPNDPKPYLFPQIPPLSRREKTVRRVGGRIINNTGEAGMGRQEMDGVYSV